MKTSRSGWKSYPKRLTVIGQDLKSLINTDTVLDDNEKILDNQDLAFSPESIFPNSSTLQSK